MSSSTAGLSILSFNVFAAPVCQHVEKRIPMIAARLHPFDIVCLQECFQDRFVDTLFPNSASSKNPHPHENSHLSDKTDSSPFRYVKHFQNSSYSTGLVIASRYPIVSTDYIPYSVIGKPERLLEGNVLVHRGIAVAKIRVPNSVLVNSDVVTTDFSELGKKEDELEYDHHHHHHHRKLNESIHHDHEDWKGENVELLVFNTHLTPQFQKYKKLGCYEVERNAPYRLAQMLQFAKAVVMHASGPRGLGVRKINNTDESAFLHHENQHQHIVICGDFNATAESPELKLLRAYCSTHLSSPVSAASPRQQHEINIRKGALVKFELQTALTSPTDHTVCLTNMYNQEGAFTYLVVLGMQEDLPAQLDHILFGVYSIVDEEAGRNDDVEGGLSHRHGLVNYVPGRRLFMEPLPVLHHHPASPRCEKEEDNILSSPGHQHSEHLMLSDHYAVLARVIATDQEHSLSGNDSSMTSCSPPMALSSHLHFAAKVLRLHGDIHIREGQWFLGFGIFCILFHVLTTSVFSPSITPRSVEGRNAVLGERENVSKDESFFFLVGWLQDKIFGPVDSASPSLGMFCLNIVQTILALVWMVLGNTYLLGILTALSFILAMTRRNTAYVFSRAADELNDPF